MLEYYCVFKEDIPYTQHKDGPFETLLFDGTEFYNFPTQLVNCI